LAQPSPSDFAHPKRHRGFNPLPRTRQEVIDPLAWENQMKTFLLDDTGLELSEYAVAAALVAMAVVAAFTSLGDAIGAKLNQLVGRVAG
jgi:pilus assembly protein Flp/PilA